MATGKVAQVIGTVVDVEFPPDQLPSIFDALNLDNGGENLVLEVQQHIGNNWVRCLALGSTDGLARGVNVDDTGQKVMVPVGNETLGRLFNVTGTPLDDLGPVEAAQTLPIHRDPPAFDGDNAVVGQEVAGLIVQTMDKLDEIVKREAISIAIVAVPVDRTQHVIDRLMECGVQAILNYAPIAPQVLPGVRIRNIDPVLSLQSMTYYLGGEGES